MLTALDIRDVVLIDRLELEFPAGLTALTGETGAGKSILLDALGLALGARGDARLVRAGADRATVSATFDTGADHAVLDILAEHGIDDTGEGILVRRVLGADGRSRAFVNDQPVGVGLLRRIGDALVEVHGQFESQRLLDPASHRGLLDAHGGLESLVEAVSVARKEWRAAGEACILAANEAESARRDEEFLRHAADELAALDPQPGQEANLAAQRTLMMNAEKLVTAMGEAGQALAGSGGGRGAEDSLRAAMRPLERIASAAEGRLDAAIAALDRAASEAAEGQALLERAAADMDLDPARLETIEERLFALRALARKHGCEVDDLAALRDDIDRRLAAAEHGAAAVERLAAEERAARERYMVAAESLSKARVEAAGRLDPAVAEELEPLKLGKASFATRIERADEDGWGEAGWDRVAFEVATNPGTPAGPLTRIASGGELARFMLALKVVLAGADPVPTLVFDEVDAGIGGAVAAAVGERLARLAADVQVLVVTHSPQVAARGDQHWRVTKATDDASARTGVESLDATGRQEEIARMLAGARVTDEARAAADSLLKSGAA